VPLADAESPSPSSTDAWFTDLVDDPLAPVGGWPRANVLQVPQSNALDDLFKELFKPAARAAGADTGDRPYA
jgi:hypothetical protein